jgi:hypothetical protein
VPGWLIFISIALLTLAYLAFVDFIYVARLAAYVSIVEAEDSPVPLLSYQPPFLPRPPASEDDILSDIPGLVTLPAS